MRFGEFLFWSMCLGFGWYWCALRAVPLVPAAKGLAVVGEEENVIYVKAVPHRCSA